jgi:hypothetical protein
MKPPRNTLTWGQFKRMVEGQGVVDDTEIFYIDIHADLTEIIAVRNEYSQEYDNPPNQYLGVSIT